MKLIKKIFMVIILFLMVVLDIWIIKDFEVKIVKSGVIDKNEKIKVKMKYSSISASDLFENYEYMRVFNKNIFGKIIESLYIDINGNEFYKSSSKNNWKETPYFYQNRASAYSISLDKEGYIDWNENKTSEFIYEYTDDYQNGYAKVGIFDKEELKYGVIDLDGNQVIPCMYKNIDMRDCDFDIFYVEDNNNTYIINNKNIKIIEFLENDKIKFLNLNELTDIQEIDIENVAFSKDYILICGENGKYGFFTKEGEQKCSFKYDSFKSISSQYLFLVEESGKRYVIDDNLNIVFNTEIFDEKGIEINSIENGRIRIEKDNKYGIADLNGNIIIEPKYDAISIQTAKKGYFSIEKDNKYGLMDLNGNDIIKLSRKYKSPILGNGEFFVVEKVNINLLIIWLVLLILTFIIEIFLVRLIIKRN
ncbi:MAG: WG repeat-containing protein [Clostridia bacterium]|nr:WG repeat-containing protein [Clostridia bacterium]